MNFTLAVGVFFLCSLVNVMLSTCKTVLTVKASKGAATLINACTYGFYAIVVKQLASFDLIYTVSITIITNIIGVYASLWILEKFSKDKLWKIEVTIPTQYLELVDMELAEIPHSYIYISDKHTLFNFYCSTQKESKEVKEIVNRYNAKYFVAESKVL